jgi:MFS family permease
MKRELRWHDTININIYYLGLTAISQSMVSLFLPLLVQRFVGETRQGSYIGLIRLWGLLTALLSQAVMGLLSDHSSIVWGKRRPFILAGGLLNLVTLCAIGFTAQLSGMHGFWLLFSLYIILQFGVNTSQGAVQCFIPDLVPREKHGMMAGIKAVLEAPVAVIIVTLTIGRLVERGNLWGGFIALMIILLIVLAITMTVKEQTPDSASMHQAIDWKPILRLMLMTGVFASFILIMGAFLRLMGRWLADVESPGVLLVVMGGLGLLSMAIAIILGVYTSVHISISDGQNPHIKSFSWWVTSRLAFLVGTTNLGSFALYFLQTRLGYAGEKAAGPVSQMTMMVGIFLLISALLSGWLTDRFGHKVVTAASGFIAALGTLMMLLATNKGLVLAGGSVLGIAVGLFYTASWALGTNLVPPNEVGRYLGISNLAGAGAGAVGAYIGGPLADFFTVHTPQVPGLGYVLIFTLYGLLFLLSIFALTGVKLQQHTHA